MIAFRVGAIMVLIIAVLWLCSCEVHIVTDSNVHNEDFERDGLFFNADVDEEE